MNRFLIFLLLAGLPGAASAVFGAGDAPLLRDTILDERAHHFPNETFEVVTVHGVTFQQEGVVTHDGWQYATFYDENGHVSVARRLLPDGKWEVLTLTDYAFTTVDSHNSVVLGICAGDGSIHLSFDHHNDPLKYRKSVAGAVDDPENTEWTPDLFGPIRDRLDGESAVSSLTYPRFIPTREGDLLFTFRIGGSGGGDEVLYEYDGATGEWTRLGEYIERSGFYSGSFTGSSTSRNAYPDNTVFDRTGRLHMTWCWRETPNARSNHDIQYAYSDDGGRTWKNNDGDEVASAGGNPITIDTPGIKVADIPQNRNYINNSAMTVDLQGRVHVVAWHLPDSEPDQDSNFTGSLASPSRFHHYWRDTGGTWHRNETDLTGTRAKLAADEDGYLYLAYGTAENVRIARAAPGTDWSDWAEMNPTGALPEGRADEVNLVIDPFRWETDRILSIYAQETNAGDSMEPTPLHVLDYGVSRSAVVPEPVDNATGVALEPSLAWTGGREAVAHDVYFGEDRDAVAEATPDSAVYFGRMTEPVFAPGELDEATEYFWRIDSVQPDESVVSGRVWTFETLSLVPQVSAGEPARAYGGELTFTGTLVSADGSPADVALYRGSADGGTEPEAWDRVTQLGAREPGPFSTAVAGAPEEAVYFRYFASNLHGSSWSPVGKAPVYEDLARWRRSAPIEIDFGEQVGALSEFPILIRLEEDSGGFAYDELCSPPYGDLRFSDESGEVTLPYEVERWEPGGTSLVWVQVPEIAQTARIRAWWGREGRAAPPAERRAATWSGSYAGIWHLDNGLGFGLDSSPNGSPGTSIDVVAAESAVVPGAAGFDGESSAVRIDNSPALNPGHLTVEAWIRTSQTGGTPSIISKDQTSGGFDRVWQFRVNDGRLELIVFNSGGNGSVTGNTPVADGEWRHVAGTWDGETIRVFVDGEPDGAASFSGSLRTGQSNDVFIGRMQTNDPSYFQGAIDEVRVSGVARSAGWIRGSWLNQNAGGAAVEAGAAARPDLDDDLLPDAWEMEHLGTTAAADGRALTDSSGNGVPDLIAYAMGLDPASPASFPAREPVAVRDGVQPEFTYRQIAGGEGEVGVDYTASGLRYRVEVSHDLTEWVSGADRVEGTGESEPMPDGTDKVTVRLIGLDPERRDRVFARVKVEVVE